MKSLFNQRDLFELQTADFSFLGQELGFYLQPQNEDEQFLFAQTPSSSSCLLEPHEILPNSMSSEAILLEPIPSAPHTGVLIIMYTCITFGVKNKTRKSVGDFCTHTDFIQEPHRNTVHTLTSVHSKETC